MEVKVLNIEGKESGKTIQLNDNIFNIEPHEHAVYLDVKRILANRRQGTHKAKEKSELSGSTRKLFRQKGTGRARAGSIKNPLYRGGARIFGPRRRKYTQKLNKKVVALARCSALSQKLRNNELIIVEHFEFDSPKVKNMLQVKQNLKINDKKSTFVFKNKNNNVFLSARNLQDTKVLTTSELNTYTILNNKALVLTTETVEYLNTILANNSK